jgi:hypothetical protein
MAHCRQSPWQIPQGHMAIHAGQVETALLETSLMRSLPVPEEGNYLYRIPTRDPTT